MGNVKVEYTYEDYLALDDDQRYEILDGELIVVPAPNTYHQKVQIRLSRILSNHVLERGLGEVLASPCDLVLSEKRVVQPDILYVSSERLSIIRQRAVEGGPDLVVEILSPSSKGRDRGPKAKIYAEAGVREYWIIDPDAAVIEIYRAGERGFTLHARLAGDAELESPILPDLRFRLPEVFP